MELAPVKSIMLTIVIAWSGALWAQDFVSEMIPTQLVEEGTPIRLELLIRKPSTPGPYPTVVFNHGSTGRGDNPDLFQRSWTHLAVAKVFNEKGWMIVFPQRRGRGQSNGKYDEGFEPDRSRYSCQPALFLAGLERAILDLDEVMAHLKTRSDVRHDRLLIAGQSRGGILSIAYAGVRPNVFTGAVNFVGGWMTDRCPDPGAINTATFRRGAAFKRPTLWLYGEADRFYSLSHSKDNFEAFKAAGGTGTFHAYWVPGNNSGHGLISHPALWQDHLSEYLRTLD
jgi:pimeloyl-ACP methyl ester carboxylesterase